MKETDARYELGAGTISDAGGVGSQALSWTYKPRYTDHELGGRFPVKRTWNPQIHDGRDGALTSFKPASAGVLPPFFRLQSTQHVTMFSHSVRPPRERGTT